MMLGFAAALALLAATAPVDCLVVPQVGATGLEGGTLAATEDPARRRPRVRTGAAPPRPALQSSSA